MLAAVSSIILGIQRDAAETDQDTADRLGVSAGTVANARNRRGSLSTLTLLRIGKEYGLDRLAPVMHLIGGKVAPETAVCTSDMELPVGAARGQLFLARALLDQHIDDGEIAAGALDIEAGGQAFDGLRWRLNKLRATGLVATVMER